MQAEDYHLSQDESGVIGQSNQNLPVIDEKQFMPMPSARQKKITDEKYNFATEKYNLTSYD